MFRDNKDRGAKIASTEAHVQDGTVVRIPYGKAKNTS
jgi:hypothetical protein